MAVHRIAMVRWTRVQLRPPPQSVIRNRATQSFEQVMEMDSYGHPEEVPYWAPRPASVTGHRAAAEVLPSEADRLLSSSCESRG